MNTSVDGVIDCKDMEFLIQDTLSKIHSCKKDFECCRETSRILEEQHAMLCNANQKLYEHNQILEQRIAYHRQRQDPYNFTPSFALGTNNYATEMIMDIGGSDKQDSTSKNNEKWNQRYQELQEYRETYGHCVVPQRYKANPKLGIWVATQRNAYEEYRLDQDRIEKLDQLGFVWDVKRDKKKT